MKLKDGRLLCLACGARIRGDFLRPQSHRVGCPIKQPVKKREVTR